jgi:hypothetical protein
MGPARVEPVIGRAFARPVGLAGTTSCNYLFPAFDIFWIRFAIAFQ